MVISHKFIMLFFCIVLSSGSLFGMKRTIDGQLKVVNEKSSMQSPTTTDTTTQTTTTSGIGTLSTTTTSSTSGTSRVAELTVEEKLKKRNLEIEAESTEEEDGQLKVVNEKSSMQSPTTTDTTTQTTTTPGIGTLSTTTTSSTSGTSTVAELTEEEKVINFKRKINALDLDLLKAESDKKELELKLLQSAVKKIKKQQEEEEEKKQKKEDKKQGGFLYASTKAALAAPVALVSGYCAFHLLNVASGLCLFENPEICQWVRSGIVRSMVGTLGVVSSAGSYYSGHAVYSGTARAFELLRRWTGYEKKEKNDDE